MTTRRPLPTPTRVSGKFATAGVAVAFAVCTFSFPIFMATNVSNPLWTSEKPMGAAAVRRGAFMNSGSKDVGIDSKR